MDGFEDNAAYDNMLLEIIKREGKVDSYINIVFGFLQRNTDFFRIMPDPSARFGFPPGVARAKVLEAMKLFEERSFQLYPDDKKLVEQAIRVAKSNKNLASLGTAKTAPTGTVSTPPGTVELETNNDVPEQSESPRFSQNAAPSTDETTDTDSLAESIPPHAAPVASPPATPPPSAPNREETASSDFQNNADTYNGAARDNYSWGQTIKDLDLRVCVGKDVKKAKQLRVEVKDTHIKVQVRKEGGFETLVDGTLKWKVHSAESVWTLVPGDHVHISLDKVQERWWESCFQDEPEISLKSIDCSRPMEDLDAESLATVNKLKFDQMQKELGKPTSDQLKVMDQLKEGWDAEGSPFKGQPFDPSVLDFGGS